MCINFISESSILFGWGLWSTWNYQAVKEILNLGKGYFSIEVDRLYFTAQSNQPTTISSSSLRPTVGKRTAVQPHTGNTAFCACVYLGLQVRKIIVSTG